MSTSGFPLFQTPNTPTDPDNTKAWNYELPKGIPPKNASMNLAYLRSDSTAASSGGDAAFPLIDDHLAFTLGGAFDESSFMSADPPKASDTISCNQTNTSTGSQDQDSSFGTPPVIKTLLDDVDWSLNTDEDSKLLTSTHTGLTTCSPEDAPPHLSNFCSNAGVQWLHNLLEQNPEALPTVQHVLSLIAEKKDYNEDECLKEFFDLILLCHLTGQLLNNGGGLSPTSAGNLDEAHNSMTNDVMLHEEADARQKRSNGALYVFPPPPTVAPPTPLPTLRSNTKQSQPPVAAFSANPSPFLPRASNLDRIFDSLKTSLNEVLSQLMTPVMNGFFQQSLPSISRWRNIDVTFPILLPSGHLCVSEEQDIQKMEVFYSFEDPDLQSVFGSPVLELFSAGDESQGGLTPASLLRTRVAVIHKCPDFLVSKMSQLFHELIASQCPVLDEPITLSCTRVSRCSVPYTRQSNTTQSGDRVDCHERIEALVSPATPQDEKRLLKVSALLWSLADVINNRLAQVVSSFYSRIPQSLLQKRSVPEDLYNSTTRKVGLEFRFAPSKQMKIVLAQRSLHQPSSLLVKRVDVTGIQLCEIRLEQDRRLDKEWDPLLLEQNSVYVPTKRILRDDAGDSVGRAVLVSNDKIRLPRVYRMNSAPH